MNGPKVAGDGDDATDNFINIDYTILVRDSVHLLFSDINNLIKVSMKVTDNIIYQVIDRNFDVEVRKVVDFDVDVNVQDLTVDKENFIEV